MKKEKEIKETPKPKAPKFTIEPHEVTEGKFVVKKGDKIMVIFRDA